LSISDKWKLSLLVLSISNIFSFLVLAAAWLSSFCSCCILAWFLSSSFVKIVAFFLILSKSVKLKIATSARAPFPTEDLVRLKEPDVDLVFKLLF
jgi:hypothetical protein